MNRLPAIILVLISFCHVSPGGTAGELRSPCSDENVPPLGAAAKQPPTFFEFGASGGIGFINSQGAAFSGRVGTAGEIFLAWRLFDTAPIFLGASIHWYSWSQQDLASTQTDVIVGAAPDLFIQTGGWGPFQAIFGIAAGPAFWLSHTSDNRSAQLRTVIVPGWQFHGGILCNFTRHVGLQVGGKMGMISNWLISTGQIGLTFQFH